MPTAVPAIDANLITAWNEQEQAMYNSYPFYLASFSAKKRKTWSTHSDRIGKKKWTPNMGSIMRGVRKEESPNIRQEARPQELGKVSKKDIIDVQEMTVEATLKHQKFESRAFPFYPSFVDFMKDHVKATSEDIARKIQRYEDLFVRTAIFHMSPHVYVCNRAAGEVVTAPMWDGKDMSGIPSESTEGTTGKTIAYRQQLVPQVGNPGNLTLVNCFMADSFMREDIRAEPYSGSYNDPKDNSAVQGLNCLVLSNEAYNQFRFDPFVLQYKNLTLDLIKMGYTGAISDNIVCKVEDLPLRMKADGTFPRPEARELNPDAYNKNESIVGDDYKNAPFEWAFLYAAEGYQSLQVGPPPSDFTSGYEPKGFKEMFWNGEIKLTKDFLIPVLDENGAATLETNNYGEHMKFISHLSLGILGVQRRNVLPILFKRVRGVKQS